MTVEYTNNRLTTLQIYYYVPDYTSLIQEFVWQYEDCQPQYPRTHQFLNYWHINIDAVISEILLAHTTKYGAEKIQRVDWFQPR